MNQKDFKLDFIGIGAPRCATSWIYQCLKEHPQICMPWPKGTDYFSEEKFKRVSYHSFFNHCKGEKVKGEFGPVYYLSQKVAQRIKIHNPEVKLMICLRDPVVRAYTNYLSMNYFQGRNWKNFREALEEDSELKELGFYYKYLKNYFQLFPKENILILLMEDIKKSPLSFIQNIYSFLGVDSSFEPLSAKSKMNTSLFKLSKLGKFIHNNVIYHLKKTKLGRKIRSSPSIRRKYYKFATLYAQKRGIKKPTIDIETKHALRNLYEEDISNLENLINRDLNFWK